MNLKTITIALSVCALGLLLSFILGMAIPGFIPIIIFLPFIFFRSKKRNDDQSPDQPIN